MIYRGYWFPMGIEARVRRTPWATLALLAVWFGAYGFLRLQPSSEAILSGLGFTPAAPSIRTALTGQFIHASFLPLFGCALFLWIVGPPLESRLGTARFLTVLLLSGWLAALAHALWVLWIAPAAAYRPAVGATGAVTGLLGAYAVRLHDARLRFVSLRALLRDGITRTTRFAAPAYVLVGAWLGLTVLIEVLHPDEGYDPLANGAGLLLGGLLAAAFGAGVEGELEGCLVRGARLAERGEWTEALSSYRAYLERVHDDPGALEEAARIERILELHAASTRDFGRAIQLRINRGEEREACDTYREMTLLLGEASLAPRHLLRLARGYERGGRLTEASRTYEACARVHRNRAAAAVSWLKSAWIEERGLRNPGRASALYAEALDNSLPEDLECLARERLERARAGTLGGEGPRSGQAVELG